jgi:hypothetical protein
MSDTGRKAPPEAQKEGERKLNWHLTEKSPGAWSVGTTLDEVGFYPAAEDTNATDSWVAPGDFVEKYLKDHDEERSDGAIREAIVAWRKQEGK